MNADVIDAHTHMYDPDRPQGVPWPDKSSPIYRTVLPQHFLEMANPQGIAKTVVVEASVWPQDNDWILQLAENNTAIVGFVGNLDLTAVEFAADIERLSKNPIFRGIRSRPSSPDTGDATVAASLRLLERGDLSLDLLARAADRDNVLRVVDLTPDLRVVIDHVGHPTIEGGAPDRAWEQAMRDMAGAPNVYCKVSGLVEAAAVNPAPPDLAYYTPTLDVLWDAFGPERLIYASNWPVCELHGDYATTVRLIQEYTEAKGEEARRMVFSGACRAAYKPIDRA